MADYIYKNVVDSTRFKIFKVDVEDDFSDSYSYWNVDIWVKETGDVWTYASEFGDVFYKKRDAKSWIEENYGSIKSISVETVTEGW